MKITKIDVYMLDASEQRGHRKPVIARIHTDEGIYGDGEAGIALGTGATGAFGMVQDLAALIIGMDPMNVEPLWERLMKASFWGQGGGAIVFAGISALDIALLDIKGKALGVPVYQLLGGKYRSELRTYASQLQFGWTTKIGPYGSPEDYVMITQHALSEGYDAVKIDFTQIAPDGTRIPKREVEGIPARQYIAMIESRMEAIRRECGYDFDLIVENHCRTDAVSAVIVGELCDKYKAFAYEEPTTPLNPDMHKYVHEKIRTPIASGERIFSRWGFMNYFKENAVQLIQPDICNCGGLSEAKRICEMATCFDVTVQAHCAGSPISTAAALQLEAAISNFCIHEHHFRSTQPALTALCKYDYQPYGGKYTVPELPGLGQEMSPFAMENAIMHVTVDTYAKGL
jgi:L-alanine-DL-glutamate epimerase-like enolase superfamily enzyme